MKRGHRVYFSRDMLFESSSAPRKHSNLEVCLPARNDSQPSRQPDSPLIEEHENPLLKGQADILGVTEPTQEPFMLSFNTTGREPLTSVCILPYLCNSQQCLKPSGGQDWSHFIDRSKLLFSRTDGVAGQCALYE